MTLTPRRTEQVLQIKREYEAAGYPAKRLGVTWNNLTVKGKASSTVLHDTVLSLFNIPEKIKMGRRPVRESTMVLEQRLEDSLRSLGSSIPPERTSPTCSRE